MTKKCWYKDCNKPLIIKYIRAGFCPEHGHVWEEDYKLPTVKVKNDNITKEQDILRVSIFESMNDRVKIGTAYYSLYEINDIIKALGYHIQKNPSH